VDVDRRQFVGLNRRAFDDVIGPQLKIDAAVFFCILFCV